MGLSAAEQTRSLCILLVIQAVVSYRSIPRLLKLMQTRSRPELGWIPHFSSVIHWTLRLGLGLLQQVKPINAPWLAIIDHSIDVGTKKVLVVLRVRLDTLSRREGALQLADCECIGLQVSETVNGESVGQALGDIFRRSGTPLGIIKDRDATLNKGVKVWSTREAPTLGVIDDIGHVMATALKKHYQDTDAYTQFIAWTTQAAKQFRQTALAFLVPPKLRNKGRFMSIGRLGKWGRKWLDRLGEARETPDDATLLAKVQATLPDSDQQKAFIHDFAHTTTVLSQVMKILKNRGLDNTTCQECRQLSGQLPDTSGVKQSLLGWLDKHIALQQRIARHPVGHYPLPISSDVIESLFGCFKHIIGRNPQADMNRSVLLIPVLCGTLQEATISTVLGLTPHAELQKWEQQNIPYTLRKKRQEFFHPPKPKTGTTDP
jgi:hypothetical protein